MNDESDSKARAVSKVEKAVEGSGIAETIINVFKAGLASAPFAGGIASLIADYIPSARFLRLEQFAEDVAGDLTRLQDRVDAEYIRTDEFAFIFEQSFRGAARHPQEEKLRAFRSVLVNSTIREDLAEEEKEYFLTLVNRLSVLHIRILRFMAMPSRYLADLGIPEESVRGGFRDMFQVAIPGISTDVVRSAFGDLYEYDLISTDQTIFSTMTASQGLDLLGDRVTNLGRTFIEFCTVPE